MLETPKNESARVCLQVCAPQEEENGKGVTVLNADSGVFTSKLRVMVNSEVGLQLKGTDIAGAVVHVTGYKVRRQEEGEWDDDSVDNEDDEEMSKVMEMDGEIEDLLAQEEKERSKPAKLASQAEAAKNKKSAVKHNAVPGSGITRTVKGGLKVQDLLVGAGALVRKGHNVAVKYTLRLENGNVVDKTKKTPFKFRLGVGECVKGFDLGIAGMRVGGERHLVIPSELGYGRKGAPPDIPANATLYFDVKVMKAW